MDWRQRELPHDGSVEGRRRYAAIKKFAEDHGLFYDSRTPRAVYVPHMHPEGYRLAVNLWYTEDAQYMLKVIADVKLNSYANGVADTKKKLVKWCRTSCRSTNLIRREPMTVYDVFYQHYDYHDDNSSQQWWETVDQWLVSSDDDRIRAYVAQLNLRLIDKAIADLETQIKAYEVNITNMKASQELIGSMTEDQRKLLKLSTTFNDPHIRINRWTDSIATHQVLIEQLRSGKKEPDYRYTYEAAEIPVPLTIEEFEKMKDKN